VRSTFANVQLTNRDLLRLHGGLTMVHFYKDSSCSTQPNIQLLVEVVGPSSIVVVVGGFNTTLNVLLGED
jgi:hypothetical protein